MRARQPCQGRRAHHHGGRASFCHSEWYQKCGNHTHSARGSARNLVREIVETEAARAKVGVPPIIEVFWNICEYYDITAKVGLLLRCTAPRSWTTETIAFPAQHQPAEGVPRLGWAWQAPADRLLLPWMP